LELLPKVIFYSYECINKSKQTNFLTLRNLLGGLVHFELQYCCD